MTELWWAGWMMVNTVFGHIYINSLTRADARACTTDEYCSRTERPELPQAPCQHGVRLSCSMDYYYYINFASVLWNVVVLFTFLSIKSRLCDILLLGCYAHFGIYP